MFFINLSFVNTGGMSLLVGLSGWLDQRRPIFLTSVRSQSEHVPADVNLSILFPVTDADYPTANFTSLPVFHSAFDSAMWCSFCQNSSLISDGKSPTI